jgi:hypothetical protein
MLFSIFQGRDSLLILRRIRDNDAQEIESNLRIAFAETKSAIPLDMLASYLAGARIALVHWWLGKRRLHTSKDLAQTFHRLQRAAICTLLASWIANKVSLTCETCLHENKEISPTFQSG